MTSRRRRRTTRVSVDFFLVRIASAVTRQQMRNSLGCIRDVVESLFENRRRTLTASVLRDKVEEIFSSPPNNIRIPFMFPNSLNEGIRRALWPRCMHLMENAGMEHLLRQRIQSVELDSLQTYHAKVELATKDMCDRIPSVRYDSTFTSKKRKRKKEVCAVCLSNLRINSQIKKLPHCGHMFHAKCIDMCFSKTAIRCPTCRDPVSLIVK